MADPVAAAAPLSGADPFEVGYVDGVGRVVRSALKQCWHVRFEDCRPSRAFPVYRGRQNFTAVGGTARLPTMLHAAGITTPLNCWVAHEHDVCLRHQRLIGTGCQSTQGPRRPPAAAPCLPRPTTPPQPAGTTRPTLASWTLPRSPGHLPKVVRAARVRLTARSRPPDGRPCQRHTAPSRHERDPARDLPSGDRRTDRPSRLRPLGASALRGQRRGYGASSPRSLVAKSWRDTNSRKPTTLSTSGSLAASRSTSSPATTPAPSERSIRRKPPGPPGTDPPGTSASFHCRPTERPLTAGRS